MSKTKFTSIKSVLYDLSSIIPKRYWDETQFLEWASKGLLRVGANQILEEAVKLLVVSEHSTDLPDDFKYLIQAVGKVIPSTDQITEIQSLVNFDDTFGHMANPTGLATNINNSLLKYIQNNWTPLALASSAFIHSVKCDTSIYSVKEPSIFFPSSYQCEQQFAINADLTLTTSFKEGLIMLAYLRIPRDEEGYFMIPDEEELKEALLHYCLWFYWMKKATIQEPGADRLRDHHRRMFGLMKSKANAKIEDPDIHTMENIKNRRNHLYSSQHQFNTFFGSLGQGESNKTPF